MAEALKTGDYVEITLRGMIGAHDGNNNTHRFKSESGNTHFVYIGGSHPTMKDGDTKYGMTVKKVERLEAGKAYEDADGDVFIRTSAGEWVDVAGDHWRDGFPTRPLRKLVPETE